MITEIDKKAAKFCISYALEHGANHIRISLSKSVMDSISLLDGEVDKVSHNADCSIYMYLFSDGKYGTFSTNKLDEASLSSFIEKALEMVKLLGKDACWKLPEPERMEKNAKTGMELGLYDPAYEEITAQERINTTLSMMQAREVYKSLSKEEQEQFTVICEESEYSDSTDDNYLIDSQGFEGRHCETSFTCFSEVTIQDKEGKKYSGYWWDASCKKKNFDPTDCPAKALKRAFSQIGPKEMESGHYNMVLDSSVSSRIVSPILSALNASSIQQKVSFLDDSLNKKIFPDGMTLMDLARSPEKAGSRLFDTEGVATKDRAIIEKGVVKEYFINTYMSAKMDMAPTIEDVTRPCLAPYLKSESLKLAENDINLEDILVLCGDGICVTSFNGGNCNPVTGDFSFGVEGFSFKNGRKTHPIKGMLITGNIIDLWQDLIAIGTDARPCSRWQIPSLAFKGVSFSA